MKQAFLVDQALGPAGNDVLRTAHVADALHAVIQRSRPPLTIGLFGTWGIGKSTILGQLDRQLGHGAVTHELTGQPITSVLFDVWKYEEDVLRRQLLLTIATRLYSKGDSRQAHLRQRLFADVRIQRDVPVTLGMRSVLLLVLLAELSGVAALFASPAAGNVGAALIFAALFVGFGSIVKELVGLPGIVATKQTIETRGNSVVEPDEFEAAFRELCSDAGCLVLLLDNLDRCEGETVVRVLRTVKTFLESVGTPVFFVIACDDDAVRRYLNARERRDVGEAATGDVSLSALDFGEEFLRKFFTVGVRVAPPSPLDLVDFVDALIGQTAMADWSAEDKKTAGQLVSIVVRNNPRHVVQFLNRISAKRVLVETRCAAGLFPAAPQRPAAYIVACALEEHHAALAEAMIDQPQILTELREVAEGIRPRVGTNRWSEDEVVLRLVRAFSEVPVGDVLALLSMRADEDDRIVVGAAELRSAFEAGDPVGVVQRVSDPVVAAGVVTLLDRTIAKYRRGGRTTYVDNASEVAGALAEALQPTQPVLAGKLARAVFAGTIHEERERERVLALPAQPLLALLRVALPGVRRVAVGYLLTYLDNPDGAYLAPLASRVRDVAHRHALAVGLATLDGLLADDEARLGKLLVRLGTEVPTMLDSLVQTPTARQRISPAVLTARFNTISAAAAASDADPEAIGFRFLRFVRDEPRLSGSITDLCVQLISDSGSYGEPASTVCWRGLASLGLSETVLDRGRLAQAIGEVLPRLAPAVRAIAGPELARLLPYTSAAERPQTEVRLREWFETEPPEVVLTQLEGSATALDPTVVAMAGATLFQRWQNYGIGDEFGRRAFELLAAANPSAIGSLVIDTYNRGRFGVLPTDLVAVALRTLPEERRAEVRGAALSGLRAGFSTAVGLRSALLDVVDLATKADDALLLQGAAREILGRIEALSAESIGVLIDRIGDVQTGTRLVTALALELSRVGLGQRGRELVARLLLGENPTGFTVQGVMGPLLDAMAEAGSSDAGARALDAVRELVSHVPARALDDLRARLRPLADENMNPALRDVLSRLVATGVEEGSEQDDPERAETTGGQDDA